MENVIFEIVIPSAAVGVVATLLTTWWTEHNAIKKLNSEENRWRSQYKLKRRDNLLIEFHDLFVGTCDSIHIMSTIKERRAYFRNQNTQNFVEFYDTIKNFHKKCELIKFYFEENEIEKITQFEKVICEYRQLSWILAGLNGLDEHHSREKAITAAMDSKMFDFIEESHTTYNETKIALEQLLKEKLKPTLT